MSTLGISDPTILEGVESYCDNYESGFGEVMTLFSNDSTILEEVSIDYDENKVKEEYGVTPVQLIQVKGLMGDTSDNIPGVPGVGEKTALKLVKEYKNIDNMYKELEAGTSDIKGTLKTKLENNKDSALMSRTLGTILLDAPLGIEIEDLRKQEWNMEAVTNKFKELQFNRFIERFNLNGLGTAKKETKLEDLFKVKELNIEDKKAISEEIKSIEKKWKDIKNKFDNYKSNKPCILLKANNIVQKMIIDLPEDSIKKITVNDKKEYEKIVEIKSRSFKRKFPAPRLVERIFLRLSKRRAKCLRYAVVLQKPHLGSHRPARDRDIHPQAALFSQPQRPERGLELG